MQLDLPHTLYNYKGQSKGGSSSYKFNPNDKAIALQKEANEKMMARRRAKERGEIPYTTNELFKK